MLKSVCSLSRVLASTKKVTVNMLTTQAIAGKTSLEHQDTYINCFEIIIN